MKPIIAFIFLIIVNIGLLKSQAIAWVKTINGLGTQVVTAGIGIDGYKNIYLNGNWKKSYNGSTTPTVFGTFLFKYDTNGNEIWGDINNKKIGAHQSFSLNENAFFNSGYTFIDKFDLNNNLLWHIADTLLKDILCEYKNDQTFITGFYNIPPAGGYFLGCLDTIGNQKWLGIINYKPKKISVTNNFIYILEDKNGSSGERVFQYDTLGNPIWVKPSGMGYVWNITTDENENCYLIGQGLGGSMAKKIDSNGNTEWVYYNNLSDSISFNNGVVDNDTLYVCSSSINNGIAKSSVTLYNINTGQLLTKYFFDLLPNTLDEPFFILKDKNDIYLTGIGGDYRTILFLAKISLNNTATSAKEIKNNEDDFNIYPNPTAGIFQISYSSTEKGALQLKVINTKGEKVYEESISHFNGEYKKDIDLSKQAKGIYFIEVINNKQKQVKKIVLD